MNDDFNAREELIEAGLLSTAAEIVAIALFCAMVLVWFMVLAPGRVS